MQVQVAISRGEVKVQSYIDVIEAGAKIIDRIDSEKEQQLYEVFKKNETWLTTTTYAWWGKSQLHQTPDKIMEKWLHQIPKYIRKEWTRNPFHETQPVSHAQKDYEIFRKAGLNMAKLAKRMFDAGVYVMAGSDAANAMVIPGYGLHKELELLVEGGFSAAEALRLVTIQPAAFLQRNDIGQVAPNYKADILILDDNPLDDIRHTTHIHGVILGGKSLHREELDHMLNEARNLAAIE